MGSLIISINKYFFQKFKGEIWKSHLFCFTLTQQNNNRYEKICNRNQY